MLDVKKRDADISVGANTFLSYLVNESGFIQTKTYLGFKTDWIELNHYCRKLKIKLIGLITALLCSMVTCHVKQPI